MERLHQVLTVIGLRITHHVVLVPHSHTALFAGGCIETRKQSCSAQRAKGEFVFGGLVYVAFFQSYH